jgi:hypothetical protein
MSHFKNHRSAQYPKIGVHTPHVSPIVGKSHHIPVHATQPLGSLATRCAVPAVKAIPKIVPNLTSRGYVQVKKAQTPLTCPLFSILRTTKSHFLHNILRIHPCDPINFSTPSTVFFSRVIAVPPPIKFYERKYCLTKCSEANVAEFNISDSICDGNVIHKLTLVTELPAIDHEESILNDQSDNELRGVHYVDNIGHAQIESVEYTTKRSDCIQTHDGQILEMRRQTHDDNNHDRAKQLGELKSIHHGFELAKEPQTIYTTLQFSDLVAPTNGTLVHNSILSHDCDDLVYRFTFKPICSLVKSKSNVIHKVSRDCPRERVWQDDCSTPRAYYSDHKCCDMVKELDDDLVDRYLVARVAYLSDIQYKSFAGVNEYYSTNYSTYSKCIKAGDSCKEVSVEIEKCGMIKNIYFAVQSSQAYQKKDYFDYTNRHPAKSHIPPIDRFSVSMGDGEVDGGSLNKKSCPIIPSLPFSYAQLVTTKELFNRTPSKHIGVISAAMYPTLQKFSGNWAVVGHQSLKLSVELNKHFIHDGTLIAYVEYEERIRDY